MKRAVARYRFAAIDKHLNPDFRRKDATHGK
jgi:hypothetical protein